jgi:uncharacterized protein YegJ (DUF2314 family)
MADAARRLPDEAPAAMRLQAACLLTVLLVGAADCHRRSPSPQPDPAQRTMEAPAPQETPGDARAASADSPSGELSGSLLSPHRSMGFAVYLAAPASASQLRAAADKVKQRFPGLPTCSGKDDAPTPCAQVIAPPMNDFAAPTEQQIALFGRGLDEAQKKAAVASKGALLLVWFLQEGPGNARLREAQTVALDVAKSAKGLLWDETTRELFSPEAWKTRRIDGWEGDLPDMKRHIAIHYYETDGGRHRAISLGMEKFGLPDLVLADVPRAHTDALTTVIDAVAQELVEGASLEPGGELRVDLRSIRQPGAHDDLLGACEKGATFRGRVQLVAVEGEEGDPDNRLAELRFPSYPGASEGERQASAFKAIVGVGADRVSGAAPDDAELAAVTARVQKRLPAVAAAFRAGLPLGERVTVKAPFQTDDGSLEWMWVGVTDWRGDVVSGDLENEPANVSSLRMGAKVQVKQASIADYVWLAANGDKKEGGESAEVFERRERPKAR